MATITTRKPKTVTVQVGDYTCNVTKNHSITITVTKVVGRTELDYWIPNYYGGSIYKNGGEIVISRERIVAWLENLLPAVRDELGAIIEQAEQERRQTGRTATTAWSVAGDIIEENGGSRAWTKDMNAIRATEPIYETTTRTLHVGQQAAHSGYNLTYFGRILSITDKTVTVSESNYREGGPSKRLTLAQFCSWNYSEEQTARQRKGNQEWTD